MLFVSNHKIFDSQKEQSETKVMKIENGEPPILGLDAKFELDQSVHVRTGAENVLARTGSHGRSNLMQKLCTCTGAKNVRVRDHFFKKVHNRPN
jgi:hypothetical protein